MQEDWDNNIFDVVPTPTRVEIGIKNVYKGNADNLAEFVDAYLHDGVQWVNINTGETQYNTYSILAILSHVTQNVTNPTTIIQNGSATLKFAAMAGYELPSDVIVAGCTKNSWDKTTGTLVISNPTDNVSVTVTADELPKYNITTVLTNCSGDSSNPVTISQNSKATLNFTATNGYELPSDITVTGCTKDSWDRITGKLVISNPTGSVSITITAEKITTYRIVTSLKGCTGSSSNVKSIKQGGTTTLVFTADFGYELPSEIEVTGCTKDSWEQSTGVLRISAPIDNVSITITAIEVTMYNITTVLTNCSGNSGNATTIKKGSTATLTFIVKPGYQFPSGITVSGASFTWTKSTGVLVLTNPTGNVTITIVAAQTIPQLAMPQNVSISGSVLSWSEVENATNYDIYADNTLIGNVIGASIDLATLTGWPSSASGTYQITVKAKADGYDDSESSNAVAYTLQRLLSTPVISLVSGTTIQIDTIDDNATTIEVLADGVSIGEVQKQ